MSPGWLDLQALQEEHPAVPMQRKLFDSGGQERTGLGHVELEVLRVERVGGTGQRASRFGALEQVVAALSCWRS
ncbi:MAG: hypothetical protein N2035_10095 [Chthoniobacterales bacterium]|nr:hypothetical protein [Chthoniobacterales bacterium]